MAKKSRQPEGCSKFRVNNNKNNARAPGAIALKPPDPNKTISLNTGIKIITPNPKYKLNKDLLVLLTNSTTSRRPKNRVGKPPRPPNSFFIFMRNKIDNPEYGKQLKERVKIIAKLWKDTPKEEKEVFEFYASVAKEIHAYLYKPDDIIPTPLDSSPISATSSLSPEQYEPPYHDDYYSSDGLDDHREETLDFDLLLGQIELFDLFSTSISSDQLNQTISFDLMNNQLHETFPSDQLDQSDDETVETPILFNPGLTIDYQSPVGTYPHEIPLLNYYSCLGIDSGLMVPFVSDNEAELTEIYKNQNTDKF